MAELTLDWDPWDAAAAREDLEVVEGDFEGRAGAWQRDALGDIIVLHPALSAIERRAVLTHELIHAERGIGWGAASAATMQREEAIVRREVATRLVPPHRLARLLDARDASDVVDVALVVDAFEVPPDVAQLALSELGHIGWNGSSVAQRRAPPSVSASELTGTASDPTGTGGSTGDR